MGLAGTRSCQNANSNNGFKRLFELQNNGPATLLCDVGFPTWHKRPAGPQGFQQMSTICCPFLTHKPNIQDTKNSKGHTAAEPQPKVSILPGGPEGRGVSVVV